MLAHRTIAQPEAQTSHSSETGHPNIFIIIVTFRTPEKSFLVSNCEGELAELMRQIDVMVGQKKDVYDREIGVLANQLATRDQDLMMQKVVMQQKVTEVS